MKNVCEIVCLAVFLAFAKTSSAQSPSKTQGIVIPNFGATYEIPNPDFETDTTLVFKAVFDLVKAPKDPSKRNPHIETVARFINMHANAGVPVENLKVRIAMHGKASYGLLKNDYYKDKFGVDNPNSELLEAIDNTGVEIILCGQTARSRNLSQERRLELADIALSAMTILTQSQEEGYHLIAF